MTLLKTDETQYFKLDSKAFLFYASFFCLFIFYQIGGGE